MGEWLMTPGAVDVLSERHRQREQWGDTHDDAHDSGELGEAAAWLASTYVPDEDDAKDEEMGWAVRLKAKHAGDRRRQLVIAAALLLAEIERLDRAEVRHG